MGVSSNIMKSPSPKCYMTFWDMIIHTDTLHWSAISPNRDVVTELDLIAVLTSLPYFGRFPWTFATGAASQQRMLTTLDTWSCPIWDFVLMLRPLIPTLVISTDLLSFEHPVVLLFCFKSELIFLKNSYKFTPPESDSKNEYLRDDWYTQFLVDIFFLVSFAENVF